MSSGKSKELYCGNCKKVTHHVSLSNSDFVKMTSNRDDSGVRKAIGVAFDIAGMNAIFGTTYKCKECGTFRSNGRLWGDDYNY